MGVPQFLQHTLPTAGRKVDLREYSGGILPTHDDNNSNSSGGGGGGSRRRRPLRIGLDVANWIFKATVGCGNMLADERHLSNYGRATLHFQVEQQRRQQQQQQQGEGGGEEAATAPKPVLPYHDAEAVRRYVTACAKNVTDRILWLRRDSNADVLVVFDGASPPIKRKEGEVRSKKRKDAERLRDEPVDATGDEEGLERRVKAFRRAGAGEHYGDILSDLFKSLRENGVPFLVSPYEADGQLAYLSNNGLVDLIVTEDSDMVAYGASPILYKLSDNLASGLPRGILLRREDLGENNPDGNLDLSDFSPSMLAVLFASIGCDYCPKLKGVGIVGACEIVRSAFFEDHGGRSPLQIVFKKLYQKSWERADLTESSKAQYSADFLAALLMYRHPVVYDPVRRVCTSVGTPDPELVAYAPYEKLCRDRDRRALITGPVLESPAATFVAEGWLSPRTKRPYDCDDLPDQVRRYVEQRHGASAEASSSNQAQQEEEDRCSDAYGDADGGNRDADDDQDENALASQQMDSQQQEAGGGEEVEPPSKRPDQADEADELNDSDEDEGYLESQT